MDEIKFELNYIINDSELRRFVSVDIVYNNIYTYCDYLLIIINTRIRYPIS